MRRKYASVLARRLRAVGPARAMRLAANGLALLRGVRRGRAIGAPVSATLALTYRCNQRCAMCNFPQRARRGVPEISTARAAEIIVELARMGIYGVSFYGGEPLLRGDLVELVSLAHEKKLTVHVATNGMLLTEEAARALVGAGADLITLSMDGSTAGVHDRQRGVPGAFDRLRDAVRNIRSARSSLGRGCHCALAATLTEGNVGDVAGIVRAARDLGADTLSVFEAQGLEDLSQPRTAGYLSALARANDLLRVEKARSPGFIDNSNAYLDYCHRLFSGGAPRIKCLAPFTDIFIDAYEDVYACNHFFGMARLIGNLEGGGVRAFWFSGAYQEARRGLAACAACNYMCHRELSLALGRFLPRSSRR